MLSTVGKAFFEVATTSRQKGEILPTIYLNIRRTDTGKMVGQMRFNLDEIYSDTNIRMAFNMMDPNLVDPGNQNGSDFLEEIVVGGLIWASMDNHHLLPKGVLPYMVVHDYVEDSTAISMVNIKTREILLQYGCSVKNKDVFVFDPQNGSRMLSEFLKNKQ